MSKKADKDGLVADVPPTPGPFWKTPFNHDTTAEAIATAQVNTQPSLTQQHAKDETDINVIVKRFSQTGLLPQIPVPPIYMDNDEPFDFRQAMEIVHAGKVAFNSLDVDVRNAFSNNPQLFLAQLEKWGAETDPKKREKNLEVMRAMRLAVEPGPIADRTTLGDVLKAIEKQGTPKGPDRPKTPETGSREPV